MLSTLDFLMRIVIINITKLNRDQIMYVCVCKAVTDGQIKNAVESGACTRKQLFNCLGVGGDCGKCSRHVKEVLDSTLQRLSNQDSLAA